MARDLFKPIGGLKQIEINSSITIDRANYDRLKEYVCNRVEYGMELTNLVKVYMDIIDKRLCGNIRLDATASRIARENRQGKPAKPNDTNMPIAYAQLDSVVTSLVDLLIPFTNMYSPVALLNDMAPTMALANKMNDDATEFNHTVELNKVCFDALKYNVCGCLLEYSTILGTRIRTTEASDMIGQPVVEQGVIYAGNKIKHLDMRNTFYDWQKPLGVVASEGEFAGYHSLVNAYEINQMISKFELQGNMVDEADTTSPQSFASINNKWAYSEKPRTDTGTTGNGLSASSSSTDKWGLGTATPSRKIVMTTVFIKLRGSQFGLSNDESFDIWKFIILNNDIAYGEKLLNTKDLPTYFSPAIEDGMEESTSSFAEMLLPLQDLATYLLNMKTRALRKKNYGVNFYDQSRVDMRSMNLESNEKPESVWVGVQGRGDKPLSSYVYAFNDAPDTTSIMSDVKSTLELMQFILPSDTARLMASLDRATSWQAQKVHAESDKRTIKIGRTLNANLIKPMSGAQVTNILLNNSTLPVLDEAGEQVDVQTSELYNTRIRFKVSSALEGIDKTIVATNLKDLINTVIQRPQGEYNVGAMLRQWASLTSPYLDVSQFVNRFPWDSLTPEEKQVGYQLLIQASQQAEGQSGQVVQTQPAQPI